MGEPNAADEYALFDAEMAKMKDPLANVSPTLSVQHARFGVAPSTFGDAVSDPDAVRNVIDTNAKPQRGATIRERMRAIFRSGRR